MEELKKKYSMEEGNHVRVRGRLLEEPTFLNESTGIRFYETKMSVCRYSSVKDTVPIVVPEKLLEKKQYMDAMCEVEGPFRSYNKVEKESRHLKLFVFAKKFRTDKNIPVRNSAMAPVLREKSFWETDDLNEAFIEGYLCHEVRLRETPLGRTIADLMLAVPRLYKKTDFIPCVCWGRNAREAVKLPIGTHIRAQGRIQSRIYVKYGEEKKPELKQAYELSVSLIQVLPGSMASPKL